MSGRRGNYVGELSVDVAVFATERGGVDVVEFQLVLVFEVQPAPGAPPLLPEFVFLDTLNYRMHTQALHRQTRVSVFSTMNIRGVVPPATAKRTR